VLTGSRFVTADRRVFETAQKTAPLKDRLIWVGDFVP